MPASDILNPSPIDPLNPDYGWTKKRAITSTTLKANQGAAYFREITDIGHQFQLNFGSTNDSQKAWADIARLKRYYEQYRDGYFTLIDWEGNQRQYVGRFTTDVEPIPVGHNRWAAQNVIFEEVPGAEMNLYPSDWDNESIWFYVLNDFGDIRPAVNDWSDWTLGSLEMPSSVGPVGPATGGSFIALLPGGFGTLGPYAGTGFDFIYIPDGAVITGIEVSFQRRLWPPPGGATVTTESVQMLKAGTPVGTPKSSSVDWTDEYVTETYGGSGDLWGATWAVSDFADPNFGFQVGIAYAGASPPEAQGNTYTVTLYYNIGGQALSSDVTDAWVQMAYVGWGVQVWAPTGPSQGIANVYLDGVFISAVDQYSASSQSPQMLLQILDVSLGTHIVRVEVSGDKNEASSGYTVVFDSLQVMR